MQLASTRIYMLKINLFLLLLLLTHSNHSNAMKKNSNVKHKKVQRKFLVKQNRKKKINYAQLFEFCVNNNSGDIQNFIKQYPNFDINYQDQEGRTILLSMTIHRTQSPNELQPDRHWYPIWDLLKKYPADLMLHDKYNQTLFSQAVYEPHSTAFKRLLPQYTNNQINTLCKTINFKKNKNGSTLIYRGCPENEGRLAPDDAMSSMNLKKEYIMLLKACMHLQIPTIIQLLEHGVHSNESHAILVNKNSKAPLFVVREAFNDGPLIPSTSLINEFLKCHILADIVPIIKQFYIDALRFKVISQSPKAYIWRPVCIEACKTAKIKETDEDRCLIKIMMMPQNKLTEINKQFALKNK